MNRVNLLFNAIALVLIGASGGYVLYTTSGFGYLPAISPPDDAWFRTTVLDSSQPVVVKFGAAWCGPCRMLDPELDQLAHGGKVQVVRIDIDRNRHLARHYRVRSIPDVYLFHHGTAVAHRVGYADHTQLQKWIGQQLRQ